MLRYYKFSLIFTVICLALAAWYGWSTTGSASGTLSLLWIVVVLSVLEISLSFDNAVVNATVLQDMDKIWQRRFLTWGMLIAVFGMRIGSLSESRTVSIGPRPAAMATIASGNTIRMPNTAISMPQVRNRRCQILSMS